VQAMSSHRSYLSPFIHLAGLWTNHVPGTVCTGITPASHCDICAHCHSSHSCITSFVYVCMPSINHPYVCSCLRREHNLTHTNQPRPHFLGLCLAHRVAHWNLGRIRPFLTHCVLELRLRALPSSSINQSTAANISDLRMYWF
jgi:hypothetical protein